MISPRKKILITTIVLLAVLLEVYAHTYVPEHAPAVVSKAEADRLWYQSGPYVDSYTLNQGNCEWLSKWKIERPTSFSSYA